MKSDWAHIISAASSTYGMAALLILGCFWLAALFFPGSPTWLKALVFVPFALGAVVVGGHALGLLPSQGKSVPQLAESPSLSAVEGASQFASASPKPTMTAEQGAPRAKHSSRSQHPEPPPKDGSDQSTVWLKVRGDGNKVHDNFIAQPGAAEVTGNQNDVGGNRVGYGSKGSDEPEQRQPRFVADRPPGKEHYDGPTIMGNFFESPTQFVLKGDKTNMKYNFSGQKFEDLPPDIQSALRGRDEAELAAAIKRHASDPQQK